MKDELFSLTGDINFKKSPNMGAVLQAALDFVRRNYKTENPFIRRPSANYPPYASHNVALRQLDNVQARCKVMMDG